MIPALLFGASLVGTWLIFHDRAPKGFVTVKIPPAEPNGAPPRNAKVPPLVSLSADVSRVSLAQGSTDPTPHGALAPVTWEYQAGHPFAGEGGGALLPLLFVSPDRKFGAVLWNLDPKLGVTFAKPGDVLTVVLAQRAVA